MVHGPGLTCLVPISLHISTSLSHKMAQQSSSLSGTIPSCKRTERAEVVFPPLHGSWLRNGNQNFRYLEAALGTHGH